MSGSGTDDRGSASSTPRQLSRVAWLSLLDAHADIHGFHLALGADHGALFTEDDETLLVSFEDARGIRAGGPPHLPFGLTVAGREGWSHLCLYCEGDTFFRDLAVIGFFDGLVDDGFFDHFDRVLFYGAGPRGYAAAAFSVCAPGAEVFLVRPLATLAPDRAGWDRRYLSQRRRDFTRRYGYAPRMIEAAGGISVVHDPCIPEDAAHAALFDRADIRRLTCPNLGATPERDLDEMGILVPLLRDAGKGRLDPARFFALYRRRRTHLPYLHRVLRRLHEARRPGLRNLWSAGIRKALTGGTTTGTAP